jgi:TFIIH basal transcription factor complex TTD-A subunit
MVSAVHGVMITADVPIKQYILHLNDIAPAESKFVITDLDDTHVLVQPEHVERVRGEIARYQQSTQYVAPNVAADKK